MSIFLAEIHRSFALQLHYHGQRVQKHHHSDDRVEFLLGATQDTRGPKDPPKKKQDTVVGYTPVIPGWWFTSPSEKYEFVSWDDEIPNIWKNKIHVPNHQPDTGLFTI